MLDRNSSTTQFHSFVNYQKKNVDLKEMQRTEAISDWGWGGEGTQD